MPNPYGIETIAYFVGLSMMCLPGVRPTARFGLDQNIVDRFQLGRHGRVADHLL